MYAGGAVAVAVGFVPWLWATVLLDRWLLGGDPLGAPTPATLAVALALVPWVLISVPVAVRVMDVIAPEHAE